MVMGVHDDRWDHELTLRDGDWVTPQTRPACWENPAASQESDELCWQGTSERWSQTQDAGRAFAERASGLSPRKK